MYVSVTKDIKYVPKGRDSFLPLKQKFCKIISLYENTY